MILLLRLTLLLTMATAFTVLVTPQHRPHAPSLPQHHCQQHISHSSISTRHYALLDVPDNFFTITLPVLSILLAFSKNIARSRLEERAWEQRLQEARQEQLQRDPTLTEVDLLKREAAAEWSAYGPTASGSSSDDEEEAYEVSRSGRGRRVMTKEYDNDDVEDIRRQYTMTDEEILQFEQEFGIPYDPYYDDPYTEDELPEKVKYKVDKRYGDRIYEDGEVFYKDAKSGLYYRQGSQPRISNNFWKF